MWSSSGAVIYIIYMAKVITKEMFTNEKPQKIISLRKILTRHWTGKVEKNSGSEIEMGRKSCDRGMLGVWWADNGKVMGHWDSSAECNSSLCYICNTLNLCYICITFLHYNETSDCNLCSGKRKAALHWEAFRPRTKLELLAFRVGNTNSRSHRGKYIGSVLHCRTFCPSPHPPPWWVGSKSPPGPLSSEKRRL